MLLLISGAVVPVNCKISYIIIVTKGYFFCYHSMMVFKGCCVLPFKPPCRWRSSSQPCFDSCPGRCAAGGNYLPVVCLFLSVFVFTFFSLLPSCKARLYSLYSCPPFCPVLLAPIPARLTGDYNHDQSPGSLTFTLIFLLFQANCSVPSFLPSPSSTPPCLI